VPAQQNQTLLLEEKVSRYDPCGSDNKISNFHALIATKPEVFSARFASL
jgi:hypothetical protein